MHVAEIFEHESMTVRLHYDEDCFSPREYDNVSRMLYSHRDYTLGDGEPDDRHMEAVERGGFRLLERYLRLCEGAIYFSSLGLGDHSGIWTYLGGGAHACDPGGWDSGTCGYVYVTRERWDELCGTEPTEERVSQAVECEVDEYDKYIRGDCYGYVIESPDGEEESCWGFIGSEYAEEEARGAATVMAVEYRERKAEEAREDAGASMAEALEAPYAA